MQTEFIKLAVIFIVIMVMVLAKLKLRDAMIAAILLTVILFGIPLGDAAKLMIQSVYEKDTLLVVGSFILVTFLQRIMENRKLLERAEMALQRLSGDRRMVCVIAPVIIGFLPSAGAVNICGYGMAFDNYDIRFMVAEGILTVKEVTRRTQEWKKVK